MSREIAVAAPDAGARTLAARVSLAASAGVAGLIALLHVVRPELDPSWRFLSEYSVGANGWLMKLAFLTWAAGLAALFVALGSETAPLRARAGRWLLLAVAGALVGAGLFDQDAMTATTPTLHGQLHAYASLVGIPGTPLTAMLLSADRRGGRTVTVLANLTWVCLGLMIGYIGWAMSTKGGFGPGVYAGWVNRLVVVAYLAWQAALARRLMA